MWTRLGQAVRVVGLMAFLRNHVNCPLLPPPHDPPQPSVCSLCVCVYVVYVGLWGGTRGEVPGSARWMRVVCTTRLINSCCVANRAHPRLRSHSHGLWRRGGPALQYHPVPSYQTGHRVRAPPLLPTLPALDCTPPRGPATVMYRVLLCCVTSRGSGWACGPSPDRRYFRNTFTLTKSADTTGQLMFTLLYDDGAVRVRGDRVAACTLCLHFHSFPLA